MTFNISQFYRTYHHPRKMSKSVSVLQTLLKLRKLRVGWYERLDRRSLTAEFTSIANNYIYRKQNMVLTIENNQNHSTAMTGKKVSCPRKTFHMVIIRSDTLQRLVFLRPFFIEVFFFGRNIIKIVFFVNLDCSFRLTSM